MNKLCGHDRETLKWALTFTDGPDASKARKWSPGECEACQAVADPAKLAKIMIEEGRRLALPIDVVEFKADALCIKLYDFSHPVRGWIIPPIRRIDPMQCMHILLQWLGLPDGARDMAEKILRGET